MDNDLLTQKVIGCAIEVHKTLGPGLLESSYECCLMYELQLAGIEAKKQVSLTRITVIAFMVQTLFNKVLGVSNFKSFRCEYLSHSKVSN